MAEAADHGPEAKKKPQLLVALAAVVGGLLVLLLAVLCGLTLWASLAGLAVASPLLLLLSPVLVPAALLAWLLAAGAGVSGALALGALSILSRLLPSKAAKAPPDDDDGYLEQQEGRRRVGEVAAVAGERTPHAALAVVSRGGGQGATDHKKSRNYEHYVAGRMVQNA